ncbi:TssN family type VI secretion system protein [Saccharicrinis sp. 156]|uniref:TssN family type VI secretion system protein n=1 Tax=Saccharicrinis sp. 156 TaxID=3417574 RepID=UPI003D34DECD
MSGASLAIKFTSLIVGASILFFLYKKVSALKKFGLTGLLYVLGLSLSMALSTLLLATGLKSNEILALVIAQVLIVVLGILHIRLYINFLPWYDKLSFNIQIVLLLCVLLFAQFFSGLSFSYVVNSVVPIVWYLSLLWFLIPTLLNQTVNKFMEIPAKEFKTWQYPLNENIEDPSDKEMEHPVVISFVFRKNEDDTEYTTFRAKAPVAMPLGRLFYFFINDYNSRHPEEGISYVSESQEPIEWVFFKLKNKFFKIKEAMDPDDTIYGNHIIENDELICMRVNNHLKPMS